MIPSHFTTNFFISGRFMYCKSITQTAAAIGLTEVNNSIGLRLWRQNQVIPWIMDLFQYEAKVLREESYFFSNLQNQCKKSPKLLATVEYSANSR